MLDGCFAKTSVEFLTVTMVDLVMNFLFNVPGPINVALVGNLAFATLNFVISFGMDNSSMFDQYWAMAPVPIAYYYAFNESANWSVAGTRKILALAALTLWAVRLFSLWFLKDERENDSGGTTLCVPFQQYIIPRTILIHIVSHVDHAILQASLLMAHNTRILGS